MAEHGLSIVGVLGADVMHPNRRIFFTSDGETVGRQPHRGYVTVNGLESRMLVKVISTSGEDPPRLKHLTITTLGLLVLEHERKQAKALQ